MFTVQVKCSNKLFGKKFEYNFQMKYSNKIVQLWCSTKAFSRSSTKCRAFKWSVLDRLSKLVCSTLPKTKLQKCPRNSLWPFLKTFLFYSSLASFSSFSRFVSRPLVKSLVGKRTRSITVDWAPELYYMRIMAFLRFVSFWLQLKDKQRKATHLFVLLFKD